MAPRVIVLGVGGMGSAACYHLAKAGAEVLGLEQFEVGHARGSSHGETRVIRKAYFEHPDYVPLLLRAYELWEELSRRGGKPLYHETGIFYACPPESALAKGLEESSRRHAIPLKRLSAAEAAGFGDRFRVPAGHAAFFEPEAGWLAVEDCVRAHAAEAQRLGAHLLTGTRVLSWEADGSGVRVATDRGEHRADRLVIAGGAWSGALLKGLGMPLSVRRKHLFWFGASSAYDGAPCFLYQFEGRIFYGIPAGGALKAAQHSGGEALDDPGKLQAPPSAEETEAVRVFAASYLPGAGREVLRTAPCMYTMSQDEHFIIDALPGTPNVCFAAGFSGHGFKFASVVGEVLAELALQGATRHPIGFLRVRPSQA